MRRRRKTKLLRQADFEGLFPAGEDRVFFQRQPKGREERLALKWGTMKGQKSDVGTRWGLPLTVKFDLLLLKLFVSLKCQGPKNDDQFILENKTNQIC